MVKQNELKPFSFPSTGKTIHVKRKTSVAMLTLDLSNDPTNPKPLPPLQEVRVAGQAVVERNYFDPRYEAAVSSWENGIEMRVARIILDDVVVNLTAEDKADVTQLREERPGLPVNQSDRDLWLKYIAIHEDDDLKALLLFVRGVSEPTEEEIATTAAGFQDQPKQ